MIASWLASGLFLGSLLSLAVLMLIPQPQADTLTYLGLGAGLVLALASFITFLNLQLRRALWGGESSSLDAGPAFRQGVGIAVLLVVGAFLRALTDLGWWEAGLLVAAYVFGEITLSVRRNPFARS